jgi:dihydrofolate reductase
MRKVKLQMQMSIDGYVGGPNGEMDWTTKDHDEKFIEFYNSLIDSSDTILLGRKMTDAFVNYWESAIKNNPDRPFAKKIVDTAQVVFTKTLDKVAGKNISLAKGNLAEDIANLKRQKGKDILVYGGAGFVSSLIKEGLIDEYHLLVNPIALGDGMTF